MPEGVSALALGLPRTWIRRLQDQELADQGLRFRV